MVAELKYWSPLISAVVLLVATVALWVAMVREGIRVVKRIRGSLPPGPSRMPLLLAADLALLIALQITPH